MRIHAGLFAAWFALQAAAAEIAVPPHTAWVTDQTGTLTEAERAALETRLADFTAAKGAQVAVLLVPTTGDEPIETYALRVAEAWKLGRKGVDDGAILLVATGDRRLRIEVGYGLEGVLTDATSKRIIDETIVPHFRSGNLYAGINAGVERILGVIEGEPLPPPAASARGTPPDEALSLALFFAFFFALLFRMPGRRARGLRVPAAAAASGATTYLLTSAAFAAGVSAVVAVVLAGLLGGGGSGGRWASHRRYGDTFPGGWGGWRGGGFGGGFGGGGSFGGGGASGSW